MASRRDDPQAHLEDMRYMNERRRIETARRPSLLTQALEALWMTETQLRVVADIMADTADNDAHGACLVLGLRLLEYMDNVTTTARALDAVSDLGLDSTLAEICASAKVERARLVSSIEEFLAAPLRAMTPYEPAGNRRMASLLVDSWPSCVAPVEVVFETWPQQLAPNQPSSAG